MDKGLIQEKFAKVSEFFRKVGLSPDDFSVYVSLAMGGPMKVSSLAEILDIDRVRVYRILKNLEKESAVELLHGKPAVYSASPIDHVLSNILHHKELEIKEIRENVEDVVESFKSNIASMEQDVGGPGSFKFRFVEGDASLASEAKSIMQRAQTSVRVALDRHTFFKFYRTELIDPLVQRKNEGLDIRVVCEAHPEVKELISKCSIEDSVKTFSFDFYPVFIVADDNEVITLLETGNKNDMMGVMKTSLGFWCLSRAFASKMVHMFDLLWNGLEPEA